MKSDIVWTGDFLDGSAKLNLSLSEVKRIREALKYGDEIQYAKLDWSPREETLSEINKKPKREAKGPEVVPEVVPEVIRPPCHKPKKKVHKSGFVF